MAEGRVLNHFPPADESTWRGMVLRALEGRPFDTLISRTFEGLEIAPLYEGATRESPRAFRQEAGPWKVAARIDHPESETANRMARADLEGGANALVLTVTGAPAARGYGTRIETVADLGTVLKEIELDRVPLRVDAGTRSFEIADRLRRLAQDRRLTSAALDVDFGHDPIGAFARSGALAAAPESIGRDGAAHSRVLRDCGFAGRLFLADGRPYHEAGAGEAQELACILATALAYLRLLESAGLPPDEARGGIAFLLAADADQFLTLAKFRALRRLWARVESACGLEPKPLRLHAETSFRMMAVHGVSANVFRATIATIAAVLGGADRVTVLPHTQALGLPDEAARRLARNLQLVLIHEARLGQVADPAAGSGAFEAVTEALCRRAWALFQRLESAGGMIASLEAGLPQTLIGETAAARRAAIATRRLTIVGTSAFADLAEAPPRVLDVPRTAPDVMQPDAAATCAPMPAERDAEPFERLRARADGIFAETGSRPRVFVASLGSGASVARDLDFARDLFAAAGIEAVAAGLATPDAVAEEFARSGCRIACLCASNSVPQETIAAHFDALRAAGAENLYFVGASRDFITGSELGATVEFVAEGCDIVAILHKAVAKAAGHSP